MYHAAINRVRPKFLLLLLLSACSLGAARSPLLVPTATEFQSIPATLVPTLQRHLNTVPTLTPVRANPSTVIECPASLPSTRHRITAVINYGQRSVQVNQQISYANKSGETLQQIVLAVDANQWPDAFVPKGVWVRDVPAAYKLVGQRLTVDLDRPLKSGCLLPLELQYQINVPQISDYRGYLGYSPRQLNLGHWLAVTVPRVDGDWLLHQAILIGEQAVLEAVDWDVTLRVNNAPDTLKIAGPGAVSQPSKHTWQFQLDQSRDFTVSLSDQFELRQAETKTGVEVELYTLGDTKVSPQDGSLVDGADYALETAQRSMEIYGDLYGPYRYQRMVVVEGDFPDGMEFTGLVFVGHSYFVNFPGGPISYLSTITAHEVSHEWWYAAVGSDQAMSPWLDEALAVYSESLYIDEYYPDRKARWWEWRVESYEPQGFVDSTVYEFSTVRDYINAVYLRGALMLRDLRKELGTEAFFDLLRRYYEAGSGQLVSADFFWSQMSTEELKLTADTRRRYFRSGGP